MITLKPVPRYKQRLQIRHPSVTATVGDITASFGSHSSHAPTEKGEIQFSSGQSFDRFGRQGDLRDDSAESLFQSVLREAIVSSSGMGRDSTRRDIIVSS